MAFPKYSDEALVVLKITGEAANPQALNMAERRVLLTSNNPSIKIGRTSRRKAELEASPNNFYFDCPVMSREHAVLFLEENKVSIKDTSSLHGTCVNMSSLCKHERRQVHGGDILTFGTTVDRGVIQYNPFEVKADITFGTEMPRNTAVTYKVPDESEIEDISSDDEAGLETSPELEYTSRHLKEHGIRPSRDCQPPIDLTSDNDAPSASVNLPNTYDLTQPRASTNIPPPNPIASSQSYCIDLTQAFNETVPAVQNQIDFARGISTGLGEVFPSLDYDDDDDDDDDDLDWENDSLPDASVSSNESDAADDGPQQGFPASDDTNHAVDEDSIASGEEGRAGIAPVPILHSPQSRALTTYKEPESTMTGHSITSPFIDFVEMLPMEEMTSSAPVQGGIGIAKADNGVSIDLSQAGDDDGFGHTSQDVAMGLPTPHQSGHVALPASNHLVASSIRFLSSPSKDDLPTPVPVGEAFLDDTSAYTFEMSKKAAQPSQQANDGIVKTAEKTAIVGCPLTSIDEPLAVLPTVDSTAVASVEMNLESKHAGVKRNIDEISQTSLDEEQSVLVPEPPTKANNAVTPDEVTISRSDSSIAPVALSFTSGIALSCQPSPAPFINNPRPTKRFRRAAEVFGYVALGGVAVMSALIATAPAL